MKDKLLLIKRLLLSGKKQNFLGSPLVPIIMKFSKNKRKTALKLLNISPHYFIYNENLINRGIPLHHILEKEFSRNLTSRKEIYQKLLSEHLKDDMTVLDFGCGPGFLTQYVAREVNRIVGVDVSQGVIECAKVLSKRSNINYITNTKPDLSLFKDNTFNFVYSFAVFQHLDDEHFIKYISEFKRILKPNGKLVIHCVIGSKNNVKLDPIKSRVSLNYIERTSYELNELFLKAGLGNYKLVPVKEIAKINDDIGQEHLAFASKSGSWPS